MSLPSVLIGCVARPRLSLPLSHIDCVADSRQGLASLGWLRFAVHVSAVIGEHLPVSLPSGRIGCVACLHQPLDLCRLNGVADSRQVVASRG